jgi:hypothetical protein
MARLYRIEDSPGWRSGRPDRSRRWKVRALGGSGADRRFRKPGLHPRFAEWFKPRGALPLGKLPNDHLA